MRKFLIIGFIFSLLLSGIAIYSSVNPFLLSRLTDRFILGAISYPTSLDNFSNPGATDQVSTIVTHSTHHANHNDAIEALEAKVGITASTPTSGTVFYGNGVGSSIWSATPSITTITTTGLGTFGNILATGSSTLQNFTFLNATGTAATTTRFALTSLSEQIPYANTGGSLIPLTIGSGLSLSGGTLSASAVAATTFSFSTTSQQQLGTTTADFFSVIPVGIKHLDVFFHATSTVTSTNAQPALFLNTYTGTQEYTYSIAEFDQANTGSQQSTADDVALLTNNGNSLREWVIRVRFTNIDGLWKYGEYTLYQNASNGGSLSESWSGTFTRKNTAPITSISFTTGSTAMFATSTLITVFGY